MTLKVSVVFLGLVLVFVFVGVSCKPDDGFQGNPRDSYLDAYTDSKKVSGSVPTATVDSIKNDRKYSHLGDHPYTVQYGPPVEVIADDHYGPYSGPSSNHQYGPPDHHSHHQSSSSHYGPPSIPAPPVYGPPVPVYRPRPRPPIPLRPVYGKPHGMLGILDHINFKLDLFTIGKILLKIVIFKKIVSLIAILCLLLFVPSLKRKKEQDSSSSTEDSTEDNNGGDGNGGDDDLFRSFGWNKIHGEQRLNKITAHVLEAIENFSKSDHVQDRSKKCKGVFCNIQNVGNKSDSRLPDQRLVKLYTSEPK